MAFLLSLSVLEYEKNIEGNAGTIDLLIPHADYLHIDIMRKPFTEKDRFSEDSMEKLWDRFFKKISFDFHIMAYEPEKMIEKINGIVDGRYRKKCFVTVHAEAYRNAFPKLGEFTAKDYDIVSEFRSIDRKCKEKIADAMKSARESGYKYGYALEPGTSLNNIYGGTENADMILLMAVNSGKGGQLFIDITDKIKEASNKYCVQVDGGINDKTIKNVIDAGTKNIVIGSYITASENPVEAIKKIRQR